MTITKIENEVCTRCSGTGKHSFCTAHGSTCFKCHGTGIVLTARGKVVNRYIRSLRWEDRQVGTLVAGQTAILPNNIFTGGASAVQIEAVRQEGDWTIITIPGRKYTLSLHSASKVPVRTDASAEATLEAGLVIQETLTKTGKPTKRTPADVATWILSSK